MAESNNFVHLRVHTEYSLVDGVVRVKPLMKTVAEQQGAAVALTDQGNLFSMVKFYSAALEAGIKPIIGVDAWVRLDDDKNTLFRLVFLCKNHTGYLNLVQLISKSYLEGQHGGVPVMNQTWIEKYAEGLIVLSGGREGNIGRALLANKKKVATDLLQHWVHVFGDNFYIELQRTGRENEEVYLHEALELAIVTKTPVVATNDVRFLTTEEFEAHEVRVCIHDGRTLDDPRRSRHYTEQQYLRSSQEMVELFSDIPEAIENTVEISKRCNLEIKLGDSHLPNFPVPAGNTIETYFKEVSKQGLEKRLNFILDSDDVDYQEKKSEYELRLKNEIAVIIKMGFPGYFLIVADFIHWSKQNDIPVGPGRGSGAGSLVAYCLEITDLDPIKFDLLFERFLNPERVSLPDFDIDFCMEGRDRVIEYVANKYGKSSVSQIITYGSMAAKAVVRDVGRVLGHPYGVVDRIAKMIPFELGITLKKALVESDELRNAYENEDDVTAIIDMAVLLEGLARNAGKHAGGVVISPTVLTDFTPLYCEEGGKSVVTQFDKDDVEAIGLVKFDFLGLRTLTIIDWAVKHINKKLKKDKQELLDISLLPLEDKPTYDKLKLAETTAVFQLESRGMKELIRRLQPDNFDEIIALVALFRPGPLQSGMVDDFINRKHGRAEVKYLHPDLAPILEPTYGVILYQEQVMQIAQVLAGYTLGGADMLRRAMGKKKFEVMAKQREVFIAGAEKNNVNSRLANAIFDLMEKFAGYGFNKSHSAAYAMLSYQTAWLKTHYPSEFMAAVLSADMDNTDKVVLLIEDCVQQKLKVLPPDINQSIYQFSVVNENTIVYGLGALKGVGEAAIEGIINERKLNGRFSDLYGFCKRIDARKVNRRVIEALIKSGAMDSFRLNRSSLMASLNSALKMAEQCLTNEMAGQDELFGSDVIDEQQPPEYIVNADDWSDDQRLLYEKETLGLYLTGHPIEKYENEIRKFTDCTLANIADLVPTGNGGSFNQKKSKDIKLAGLLVNMRTRKTKRGTKIVTAILDDKTSRIEMMMFEETNNKFGHLLKKDKLVIVEGTVAFDEFSSAYRITATNIYDITQARENYSRFLEIRLNKNYSNGNWSDSGITNKLTNVLQAYKNGRCKVCVQYDTGKASTLLTLGESWNVQPTDDLLHRLSDLLAEEHVRMIY